MSSCSWYQFRNRSFVFSVHDGREIIVPLHLLPPPSLTAPIVWSVCAHRVLKLEGDVWQRVVSICARAVPWGFVSGTGRLCADWCICEVSEGYGDFAALFCLSLVIPMWFRGPFLFIPCNSYVISRQFRITHVTAIFENTVRFSWILHAYSMEQSPSWVANRFLASQEIPRILWNPEVLHRVYKSPPHVPILIQINPVQAPLPHSTSWNSILILSSHLRLGLPSCLLPSGFPP